MSQVAAPPSPKPLHIFKPGRWRTMAGEDIEFSPADLHASAAAYNPLVSKAPLVVGHPQTDDPAKGWTAALTANERGLFATADRVDPAFAEAVRAGAYGTVSAKFYRPTDPHNPVPGVWYLRHIGFLGAHPPGVKGLDAPEFAEGEGPSDGCVCFQEGMAFAPEGSTSTDDPAPNPSPGPGFWRALRDWMAGHFGPDEADRVFAMSAPSARATTPERPETAHPQPTTPPKESAVTEEEAAQLREQNDALQRQNDALRSQEQQRQMQAIRQDNAAFAETLVSERRVPAAMQAQIAAIGTQLQSTPEVAFGEGADKKPLHQVFREVLLGLPPSVPSGEMATATRAAQDGGAADSGAAFAEGATTERLEQDQRIRAYAQEHGTSYAAAAHAVLRTK